MRILVLSPRLTESRRATLRALTEGLGELQVLGAGELAPAVSEHDAIIVDGPQPARPLAFLGAIRSAVERGAALVASGAPTCTAAGATSASASWATARSEAWATTTASG